VAKHPEFERMVFEFDKDGPGYKVEYVDRPVRTCGSGEVVPLPGDAWLAIRFYPANAHTEAGAASMARRAFDFDGQNIKRLIQICDFEAVVEWVAAVGSPRAFKVSQLSGPSRVVVDIRAR